MDTKTCRHSKCLISVGDYSCEAVVREYEGVCNMIIIRSRVIAIRTTGEVKSFDTSFHAEDWLDAEIV